MDLSQLKRHKIAMWQYLERKLQAAPCDHTFSRSRAFISAYTQLNWDDVQPLLESNGAYCDCETENLLLRI